ncbi:predicted protein [Histoplasma capsulatum G186AR]|uniref:Uncharacterized protein n=1 Tax=Ajellomyces capsulatus (strain G186AR / H82 / ATCC MYA-2454 / RMSCC 2432) TaxID=447093 RepID=C0NDS8_AJECG|nr:uncharacterized protein HCBG_02021 [Histoplasma capsulatum G186AR]EEH10376.1 predicted protein [Histoplasma capsulatum G186AR]
MVDNSGRRAAAISPQKRIQTSRLGEQDPAAPEKSRLTGSGTDLQLQPFHAFTTRMDIVNNIASKICPRFIRNGNRRVLLGTGNQDRILDLLGMNTASRGFHEVFEERRNRK